MIKLMKYIVFLPIYTGSSTHFYLFYLFISFSLHKEKTYMYDISVLNKLIFSL